MTRVALPSSSRRSVLTLFVFVASFCSVPLPGWDITWASPAESVMEDLQWSDPFYLAGVNDWVYALGSCQGDLYAGGWFTVAGQVPANHVARWDGTQWSALGAGFDWAVWALLDDNGTLVAGGEFEHSGDQEVRYVARWDGSAWIPVGSLSHSVTSLTKFNGDLIAGGYYGVWRWDGTAWSDLGSGMDGPVYAVAVYGGDLVAAGGFTRAGGTPANGIARWDGTSWTPLGQGTSGGAVRCLCATEAGLFAGGEFGAPASRIARWDGSSWSPLGSGLSYDALAITQSGNDIIVGGLFSRAGGQTVGQIARWNGSSWSAMQGGMTGPVPFDHDVRVSALAVHGGTLFAAGEFGQAGSAVAKSIASWDGTNWSCVGQQGLGLDGAATAFAAHDGSLIVGGPFEHAGALIARGVAMLQGSMWAPYGTIGNRAHVASMAHLGGNLLAGVTFWPSHVLEPPQYPPEILRWNGSSWSVVGSVSGASCTDCLPEIDTVAEWEGSLFVGGHFLSTWPGGLAAQHIAGWSGNSWYAIPGATSPNPSSPWGWTAVNALVVFGEDLIAGGDFGSMGGTPALNIARFDGISWHPIGEGFNNSVDALHVYNGELIAAGTFTQSGSTVCTRIARWDGSSWQPLGSGISGGPVRFVASMMEYNGALVVGGLFSNAGGVPVANIARWTGGTWLGMGSGVNGSVDEMFAYGDGLYVGGDFSMAGSRASSGIARWQETPVSVTVSGLSVTRQGQRAVLRWVLPEETRFLRFEVFRQCASERRERVTGTTVSRGIEQQFIDPAPPETAVDYWLLAVSRQGSSQWFGPVTLPATGLPRALMLDAAPNPFCGRTSIHFALPRAGTVDLAIVDVSGRRVAKLLHEDRMAGNFDVAWDGSDAHGRALAAGMYFVRLQLGEEGRTAKLVVAH